jgi:hypothetical protein
MGKISQPTQAQQPVRPSPPVQVPPMRVNIPPPNYAPPRPPVVAPPLPPPAPRPPAPVAPRPAPVAPRVSEIPAPSVIIQANPRLPERPQQEYISKVPRYVPPPKQPAAPKVPPRPVVVTPKPPQVSTPPVNAPKMLEDHEEPHIEFKPGVARTAPPPPNLPGAMPPPLPKPAASIPPSAPRPPVQPYSADPYREPVDEK